MHRGFKKTKRVHSSDYLQKYIFIAKINKLAKQTVKINSLNPKVVFGVVLFGQEHLTGSLPSLVRQDYENCEFYLLDQEENVWSAADFIEKNLPEVTNNPRVTIERGPNLWHSGGQNKLICKALESDATIYIAASNDIYYPSDLATKVVVELEKPHNLEFGSAAVKLKQWENSPEPPTKQTSKEVLDSCGIGVTKSHRFSDRGQGEHDYKQFDSEREIFGASAALAIFRREALEAVADQGKFFDKKLHFKNDVDLAYRLNWLDWKCVFLPEIVAWHARGLGSKKSRLLRSEFEKENSTFGQLIAVTKNFDENFSWPTKMLTKLRLFLIRIFALFNEAEKNGVRKFDQIQRELRPSPRKVTAAEIEKFFE